MKNHIDLGTKTVTNMRKYIRNQNFSEGDKLPTEQQWVEILGVGRSTIREAIKILEYSQFLEVKQGAGTFLKYNNFSKSEKEKLRTAQKMIETQAIRDLLKIEISTDKWIELKVLLNKRNQLLLDGKFTEYIEADISFHTAIVRLCKNQFLIKWYSEINDLWKMNLSYSLVEAEKYNGNIQLHNELYDSLFSRKETEAIRIINELGL